MNVTFLQFPPTDLTTKNHPAFAGWLEAVEKLSFSEQPLDRNHAFDRIPKKNRALQAHFFFPCINSEIHKVNCRIAAREGGLDHALGIYEFAPQILFYACCRTKYESRNAAFLTD